MDTMAQDSQPWVHGYYYVMATPVAMASMIWIFAPGNHVCIRVGDKTIGHKALFAHFLFANILTRCIHGS